MIGDLSNLATNLVENAADSNALRPIVARCEAVILTVRQKSSSLNTKDASRALAAYQKSLTKDDAHILYSQLLRLLEEMKQLQLDSRWINT
jgi:hypothetical protein